MRSTLVLGTLAALFLVPPTWADKIYTSDGKVLEDVTIIEEALNEVTYKSGRNERKMDSQKVMRITYSASPRSFGDAEGFLLEDDIEGAIQVYTDYVDAIVSGNSRERRYKWAPANAAWRLVGLNEKIGDLKAAADAAGKLIVNFPDSRYLATAYMAKANAEYWGGDGATAQKTLGNFKAVVGKRALSERWGIECDLGLIETNDGLLGKKRRTALNNVAERAGDEFITVKNRAYVAIGESYLMDAAAKKGNVGELLTDAQDHFEKVIEDPLAADVTLAGAYAGLGDCLFAEGSASKDQAILKKAQLSFLRVAAVYPEQDRYVPKSLFYAARCFDLIGGEKGSERAQQLYGQVWFTYPGTKWATQAKNYRARR